MGIEMWIVITNLLLVLANAADASHPITRAAARATTCRHGK